jgi:hypothetical protein
MANGAELTEEELGRLGLAFHRCELVACPRCTSRIAAEAAPYMGKASIDVVFYCERCGASGRFRPQDIREEWSDAQWHRICDAYYRHGRAECPYDAASLCGGKDPTLGSHAAHLWCPVCGRSRYGDVRGLADTVE